MYKYTNKSNLPQFLVNALTANWYTGQTVESRFASTTQLLREPYYFLLNHICKSNKTEIETDVMDLLFRVSSQAKHAIFEKANQADPHMLCEKTFICEIAGEKISGTIDILERRENHLYDFKETSAYTILYKSQHDSWEKQENVYCLLAELSGYDVDMMSIVAQLRDWSNIKAKKDRNYPQNRILVIPIKKWKHKQQLEFVEGLINRHKAFIDAYADDIESAPECSPNERWQSKTVYAVMKKGRVSSVKNFDNERDALYFLEEKDDKHYLETRPGEDKRCKEYCDFGQKTGICPYWRKKVESI
jgi:hypothetical protein